MQQNIRVLTEVSNGTQDRIAGLEGTVEQAVAGLVTNESRGTQEPGFVAFVGRPNRVRSQTPTPSDRAGQGTDVANNRAQGISPPDHQTQEPRGTARGVSPSADRSQDDRPGRCAISPGDRSGRRPISPVREDSVNRGMSMSRDSRSRDDDGVNDRSHSPSRQHRKMGHYFSERTWHHRRTGSSQTPTDAPNRGTGASQDNAGDRSRVSGNRFRWTRPGY